jgi:phosphoribosylaminoimidazole (AIR) synthetase
MGVGFCVVMDPADAQTAVDTFARHGFRAWQIGHTVADTQRKVTLAPLGLAGTTDRFEPI